MLAREKDCKLRGLLMYAAVLAAFAVALTRLEYSQAQSADRTHTQFDDIRLDLP